MAVFGMLFFGGGVLLAAGWRTGLLLAMVALALFLVQLIGTARSLLNRDHKAE